jgi:hypothetical protein
MEMIERYLYAVGKKLPLNQKDDILKELRSIIMDNLDDIAGEAEPTGDDISQVLLKMGAPSEVAKRYRSGPSWLIGPKYYDLYMLILKIVLAASAGGYLISLIVGMFTQTGGIIERFVSFFVQFFGIIPGLLAAIGSVTLIFAIIERAVKKPIDIDLGEGAKWHPSKLDPVPDKGDIVKPVDSILEIVFAIVAIVIFNFYIDVIGIYYTPAGSSEWVIVDIFNQKALDIYVPIWTLILSLSIGFHGWLLGTGKHNVGTRVFKMFISAANVGVLFYMANGPRLFKIVNLGEDLQELRPITDFIITNQQIIFTVLAILTLIGLLANLGKFIYRQVKNEQN